MIDRAAKAPLLLVAIRAIALSTLMSIAATPQAAAAQDQASRSPLSYEAAFTLKQLGRADKPVLSRDGKWLAYSIFTRPKQEPGQELPGDLRYLPNGTPRDLLGYQLYLTEVATQKTRPVGPPAGNSWRPSWSPDSRQIAFFSDAEGAPQLWMHDVEKGQTRRVSPAPVKASLFLGDEAYWSPNGHEVYVRLAPAPAATAQPKAAATARPARAGPTVTVYRAGKEAEAPKPDAPAASGAIDALLLRENQAALGAIDLRSGRVRTLVPAQATPPPGYLRISPSGKWLSYLSVPRQTSPGGFDLSCDLVIAPAAGGAVQVIATDVPLPDMEFYHGVYRWHPTQDLLVYVKDKRLWLLDLSAVAAKAKPVPQALAADLGELLSTPLTFSRDGRQVLVGMRPGAVEREWPAALAVVPLDGSRPRTLLFAENWLFRGVVSQNPQALWQPDPAWITTVWRDPAVNGFVTVGTNVLTGEQKTLRQDQGIYSFLASLPDQSGVIGTYEDATTPPDLYLFGKDLSRQRRLSQVEPRLDAVRPASVVLLETPVPQHDGTIKPAKAALFLPAGAKRGDKVPTVVFLYGGLMQSRLANQFGGGMAASLPVLLFSSRGYGVLLPDLPMSPEGKAGNPLQEMVSVLLPQVYHAAQQGYSDLQRLALIGQSYGGYGAAGVIARTSLFRAAVAIDGPYDLPGLYASMHVDGIDFRVRWSEQGQGRMGTHPWADLSRYIENSPYYQVEKINTPLLLIHGEKDDIVPVEEARKMFTAAKRLGKTVQLATYAGESHSIVYWFVENAVDASKRILDFLDRYVCGKTAGQ